MPLFTPGSVADTAVSFTDNTTNDASTTKHGFLRKLDGSTSNFLRGDGTWAAASGGLTQAYVGYNTIGASNENIGTTIKAKKVTISTACLITDIEAYIQSNGVNVTSLVVALFEDNAGAVGKLIQSTGWGVATNLNMSTTPRWYGVPLGRWVTAADYWIAAKHLDNGTYANIYYDTSGSDVTWSEAGLWVSSGENASPSDSTKKYSIRANTIR